MNRKTGKRTKLKNPSLSSKVGRYALGIAKGLTKKESAIQAGYRGENNTSHIEATKSYEVIQATFKDKLLDVIGLPEIASAIADNIRQSDNRGARNEAVKIALDKIEPDDKPSDEGDKVLVILR